VGIGRESFDLLYAKGHRYFGLLCGDKANLSNQFRVGGFVERATAAGVTVTRLEGTFSWRHGYAGAQELARSHPEITAFFASTDIIAVGALHGLADMGRKVPDEISVLGVGDTMVAPYTSPALSTFRLPLHDLGAAGVALIFSPDATDETVVNLPYTYVSRGSVGVRR
jgi:DNA-binding LacI/PurR family transcriptional regulator